MSDAKVKFYDLEGNEALPGAETEFEFVCPNKNRCGSLLLMGRNPGHRHDGQGQNGGAPMWGWDGNRNAPTFTPSINCRGCWHGYIRAGRCVDPAGKEEP